MICVILAGGLGTRLSEETITKPKPMVEIGGKPILWHIMKYFSCFGVKEFIICLGYKGEIIKDFFMNYKTNTSDIMINLKNGEIHYTNNFTEEWKVHLVDTGALSMTGSRIKKIKNLITDNDFFCTYGDGLSNVNIDSLYKKHKDSNLVATVTAVQPPGRFGSLILKNDLVESFVEKPVGDNFWINGGFFVFSKEIFNFLGDDDNCVLEQEPLKELAAHNKLVAYKHNGFWQPMDTLRDVRFLQKIYEEDKCPWKIW